MRAVASMTPHMGQLFALPPVLSGCLEPGAQVHVSAAFGIDFSALLGKGADGLTHGRIA